MTSWSPGKKENGYKQGGRGREGEGERGRGRGRIFLDVSIALENQENRQ
jgi:hypothetical protein